MTDHGVELATRALGKAVAATRQFRPGPPVDGDDLPASLRFWLAHDTALFDHDHESEPRRSLGELAEDEFGEPWGSLFAPLSARFPSCIVLPGGSDSRRILALGHPDAAGESPVFGLDVDDLPHIGLMYPGFDVYVAATAGLLDSGPDGYEWPLTDPVYGSRLRHHADAFLGGASSLQWPW
ncbi:hypothetical protein AB0K00_13605 [Dactylosporangium sp. NPDC049525]|uniref:hypothetical protein n=1 Tax=Dactylosporangium sp. NPDC049525 TaxID=3154730 RepID=UPI003445F2FF